MAEQNNKQLSFDEFRQQVCALADRFIRDNNIYRMEVDFIVGKTIIVSTGRKDLTECTHFKCTLE